MSWDEVRATHKAARENAKEYGARALRAAGVAFVEHDGGWHLRIKHGGGLIDFTPGTGRWTIWRDDRTHGGQYRGVHALIHYIATGQTEEASHGS